jgi:hypothetical protein
MSILEDTLRDLIKGLSEENYDETFAQYRCWLNIGSGHTHINVQEQVNDAIRRLVRPDSLKGFIHPTAHLLIRFIGDLETDQKISRNVPGLHMQHCTSTLRSFFLDNLYLVRSGNRSGKPVSFLTDANLVARWANLGYVEEETIRDHILQSLISHPTLYDHQADALFIFFKLAGATFGTYADPSAVDRCFDLLDGHYGRDPVKAELLQVFPSRIVKGSHPAEIDFQEVVDLRDSGWEGLPPPPVFMTGKVKMAGVNEKDPAATPVMTSLGILNRDLKPQISQPPTSPIVTEETDTIPGSSIPQSPSISTATLSDFTVADTSDDELPLNSATIPPHDTFWDGNIEVLCGNMLFRVRPSVLSFHSPVLGQMLAKANLAAAESSNSCPHIPSSDTAMATDFATLLKIISLPVYVTLTLFRRVIPLTT